MNRYGELKVQVLTLFASTDGWLTASEAAERLDFLPASRLGLIARGWSVGLLQRRSQGRATLEYRISEHGRSRLCLLRSKRPSPAHLSERTKLQIQVSNNMRGKLIKRGYRYTSADGGQACSSACCELSSLPASL